MRGKGEEGISPWERVACCVAANLYDMMVNGRNSQGTQDTMTTRRRVPSLGVLSWVLFVLALVPRVLDLGRFVTHDEAEFWIERSQRFLVALQSGDFAQTAISTHPGVTTMWLGVVGILLRRGFLRLGVLEHVPFPTMLALMQLPVALVHAIGILVGYHLLKRLLPQAVAVFATVLWATDPFTIGYGRLLHVDMLMGTFATLSVLAAGVFWLAREHPRQSRWLYLSGCCAGLAVLSKSPALVLLPLTGLLALIAPTSAHRPESPVSNALGNRLWPAVVWMGTTLLTMLICWPAVWAAPARVIEVLRVGVEVEGANPHMTGNYFLGREDPAPGALFYPVTLALRTTPLTLLGLLLLPWAAWPGQHGPQHPSQPSGGYPSVQPSVRYLPVLALLAGFVLMLTAGLSLFPKKFNRYLVPAFPALDSLAAWGWFQGIAAMTPPIARLLRPMFSALQVSPTSQTQWVRNGVGVLVMLLAALNAAWWHPYALCSFNQLLGGAATGAWAFSVGWGEGFDLVADWLNRQPDSTGVVTAAIMVKTLNPYLNYGVQATTPRRSTLPPKTGYVVVYIYQAQGTVFPPFDQYYRHATPLHTVTIHGVEYAWIYQVPPEVAHDVSAQFGSSLLLRGFTLERTPEHGQPFTLSLFWQTIGPLPSDQEIWMFAHLIGPDGHRHAQGDWPIPNIARQVGRYFTTQVHLSLPPRAESEGKTDTPYQLFIGLYHQRDGQRLSLSGGIAADTTIAGPNALRLTTFRAR